MLEEMNKIWTMVGNKVYESTDFINNVYSLYWTKVVDLNKVTAQYRELLSRNAFVKEKKRIKIPPSIITSQRNALTPEGKKQTF